MVEKNIIKLIRDCADKTGGDIHKTYETLNSISEKSSDISEKETAVSAAAKFGRYMDAPGYDSVDKIIEAVENMGRVVV